MNPLRVFQAIAAWFASVISPSQLTANTDNWSPTGLGTTRSIRVSTDASRNLTGIVAPSSGERIEIRLLNVGSFNLVLVHDATSTAANRFYCPASVDFTLVPNSAVILRYDGTSSRWRVVSGNRALNLVDNVSDANKPVSTAAQAALDLKADKAITTNPQSGTSYTFVAGDAGKVVEGSNAGATTYTVNNSVHAAGDVIGICQYGAGQITVAAGAGFTLRAPDGAKSAKQYAEMVLRFRSASEAVLSGNVTS